MEKKFYDIDLQAADCRVAQAQGIKQKEKRRERRKEERKEMKDKKEKK